MAAFGGVAARCFARREHGAWLHSARVMLGDARVLNPTTGSPWRRFGSPGGCRAAIEAGGFELPFLQAYGGSARKEAALGCGLRPLGAVFNAMGCVAATTTTTTPPRPPRQSAPGDRGVGHTRRGRGAPELAQVDAAVEAMVRRKDPVLAVCQGSR